MIKEGQTPFDTVRHRHAVAHRAQKDRWQYRCQLEIGRTILGRPISKRVWQGLSQFSKRVTACEQQSCLSGIEVFDARRHEKARRVGEQGVIRGATVEEESSPEPARLCRAAK